MSRDAFRAPILDLSPEDAARARAFSEQARAAGVPALQDEVPASLAYTPAPMRPAAPNIMDLTTPDALRSVSGPSRSEVEAVEAADNAAYNEAVRRNRNRSQRRAAQLYEDIQRGAEAETGVDYNPTVLAQRFLDIPTFGLSDEILGAGAALFDPDLDYKDAQRVFDEGGAQAAHAYPLSALAGNAAGMVTGAALMGAPGLRAPQAALAPGLSTGARMARMGAVPAGVGATLGGASGYARTPDDASFGEHVENVATGVATGGAAGFLGGALRALPAAPGVAATRYPGLVALREGAGYGVAATPGMSYEPITEPGALALEAIPNAATGATMGAGGYALARAASAPGRGIGELQRLLRERRGASSASQPVEFMPVDEAALDAGIVPEAEAAPNLQLGPHADEIARATMEARANTPLTERLVREAFETDPVYARFRSAGIVDRRQIRAIIQHFGGEERALAALRAAGLAEPGIYSRGSQIEAAERMAPAMHQDLATIHRNVAAAERPIEGSRIAEPLDARAAEMTTGVPTERQRAAAASLRGAADDFRYGAGNRPETLLEEIPIAEDLEPVVAPVTHAETVRGSGGRFERVAETLDEPLHPVPSEPVQADVTAYPPEISLTYPNLRARMAAESAELVAARRGDANTRTPAQEAGLDRYRALQDVRNEEIRAVLGDAGYQDYLRRNAAARAAGVIVDGNPNGLRNPSEMLGQAAGMSTSSFMPLRVLGELQQRMIGQYRDSILATINEVGTHTISRDAMPRIVRLLEDASQGGSPAATARDIERAVRAGTLQSVLAQLEQRHQYRSPSRDDVGGASMGDGVDYSELAEEELFPDDVPVVTGVPERAPAQLAPGEIDYSELAEEELFPDLPPDPTEAEEPDEDDPNYRSNR